MTMKQFQITYTSHETIQAESLDDARKKFIEKHFIPDAATEFYDCETQETYPVIGHCEASDLPIFSTDDYESDDEGTMWLTSMLKDEEDEGPLRPESGDYPYGE